MTNIHGNSLILVDSDALIGLIHKGDALHDRCLMISEYLSSKSLATVVPYPIVLEAATTLARDKTIRRPDLAAQLLSDFASTENISYNSDVSELVSKLYKTNTSKKNSPFDHYNLALAKKNNMKYIFSFDSFYKKNGLILMEEAINKKGQN